MSIGPTSSTPIMAIKVTLLNCHGEFFYLTWRKVLLAIHRLTTSLIVKATDDKLTVPSDSIILYNINK